MGKRREKVSEKPKTYRSYGVAKIDDNFSISLNIKWLVQIIFGVAFIVLGYLRIENRLAELERRMELADSQILELVEQNQIEEQIQKALKTKPGEEGFSLVELVVVIAVLAILSAVAIPAFVGVQANARASAVKNGLVNGVKECVV